MKLRVNPEYSLRKARSLARRYGGTIGRIPRSVRQGIIVVKLSSGKDAWEGAVAADPGFISDYAAENPDREDVAESLLAWFAVRHRPSRITPLVRQTIEATIPNRLAVFDASDFDLTPFPA